MKIDERLEKELANQFEELFLLDPGSEEHSRATEDLSKLYKLRLEEDRTNREFEEKWHQRVMQTSEQENKSKSDKIKIFIDIGTFVVSTCLFSIFTIKGFKFEETGTFTSQTLKGLGKFKPSRG